MVLSEWATFKVWGWPYRVITVAYRTYWRNTFSSLGNCHSEMAWNIADCPGGYCIAQYCLEPRTQPLVRRCFALSYCCAGCGFVRRV